MLRAQTSIAAVAERLTAARAFPSLPQLTAAVTAEALMQPGAVLYALSGSSQHNLSEWPIR